PCLELETDECRRVVVRLHSSCIKLKARNQKRTPTPWVMSLQGIGVRPLGDAPCPCHRRSLMHVGAGDLHPFVRRTGRSYRIGLPVLLHAIATLGSSKMLSRPDNALRCAASARRGCG